MAIAGPGGLGGLAVDVGFDPHVLRQALDTCCTDRFQATTPDGRPALTARTARLVAVAAQLAGMDGDSVIQATHLCRALLEEPDAVAWRALLTIGITPVLVLDRLLLSRNGRPLPAPLGSTRFRLVHALNDFVDEWGAASRREAGASSVAERDVVTRNVEGARWAARSVAEYGLRLGHLTYGQLVALSGDNVEAARVAVEELRRSLDERVTDAEAPG